MASVIDVAFFHVTLTQEMYVELITPDFEDTDSDDSENNKPQFTMKNIANALNHHSTASSFPEPENKYHNDNEDQKETYPRPYNRSLAIGISWSISNDFGIQLLWQSKIRKSQFYYLASIGLDSVSNYQNDRFLSPRISTGLKWKILLANIVAKYYPNYSAPFLAGEIGFSVLLGKKNRSRNVSANATVASNVVTPFGVNFGFPTFNFGVIYYFNYIKKQ
ncbi:MAG: hypothetical protein QE271_13895 [Bacteriovoracaceae bacterium]|nr:hypothetical protein [Bacteriovoracaceae bacterium]